MHTANLKTMITRELGTLKAEILAYEDESQLWAIPDGVANSGGTLALHLCGNLQHFVGSVLGNNGYVRKRDAEFSDRNVPRATIIAEIERTIETIENALGSMTDEALAGSARYDFGKFTVTAPEFVVHLLSHLAFHLGQVDYHRRIVSGSKGDVGVVPMRELKTLEKTED